MDLLEVTFPVSGVTTSALLPPLVALIVSFFTSMGGVSGAFILLPFQMSVLGFTSPAVSSTNLVFNIVAIPSGVYRYFREGRMAWPLTWVIIAGTLPGVFLGYYLRVFCLPDPRTFKLFVGCVLLYIGGRLLYETAGRARVRPGDAPGPASAAKERQEYRKPDRLSSASAYPPREAKVRTLRVSLSRIEYEFWGERFSFSVPAMFLLALVVGVIGGTYGIGGGAIIAPFCVAVFRLPVHSVAGAALLGTFLTSVAGVVFYSVLPASNGLPTSPDWPLGALFGIGGFAGMYFGARLQIRVSESAIKSLLGILILSLAISYIAVFFL